SRSEARRASSPARSSATPFSTPPLSGGCGSGPTRRILGRLRARPPEGEQNPTLPKEGAGGMPGEEKPDAEAHGLQEPLTEVVGGTQDPPRSNGEGDEAANAQATPQDHRPANAKAAHGQ